MKTKKKGFLNLLDKVLFKAQEEKKQVSLVYNTTPTIMITGEIQEQDEYYVLLKSTKTKNVNNITEKKIREVLLSKQLITSTEIEDLSIELIEA